MGNLAAEYAKCASFYIKVNAIYLKKKINKYFIRALLTKYIF